MDFLKEFMSITKEDVDLSRKFTQSNPCEPIIRKDSKRNPVPQTFEKIIEAHENLTESELEEKLGSIKI